MTTLQDLQRSLEERAKEITALKKELEKAKKDREDLERQRRLWNTKQPHDVQTLLSQKRELQMQLEREESEKHELFLQINQLIAENAESRSRQSDVETQSRSLQVLQLENAQINAERTQLETDLGNVKRELDDLKEKLTRTNKTHEIEKARLADETAEVRREVEVKNAALQSLRLAKNENTQREESRETELEIKLREANRHLKDNQLDYEELKASNVELEQHLEHLQARLDEVEKDSQASSESYARQITDLGRQLRDAQASSTGPDELESLRRDFRTAKEDNERERIQREQLEKQIVKAKETVDTAKKDADELRRQIAQLEAEKKRLQQKASVEEELHTLINSLREAKNELSSKEQEIAGMRKTLQQREDEIYNLNSELARLKQDVADQPDDRMNNGENDELHQLNMKIDDLSKALHDSRCDADQSRRSLRDLEVVLSSDAEKHAAELDALNRRIADIIKSHESEKAQFATRINFLELTTRETHASLVASQEELTETRTLYSNALNDLKSAQQTAVDVQQAKSRLEQELNNIAMSLGLEVNDRSRCQEKVMELRNSVQQLDVRLQSSSNASDGVLRSLEVARKELALHLEEKERLQRDIEELKEREQKFIRETTEAQTRHSEELKKVEEKHQSRSTKLEEESHQLRATIARLETDKKNVTAKLKELEDAVSAQVNDEALLEEVEKLRAENAQLAGDLLKMETRMTQDSQKQGGVDADAERVRWQQEANELRAIITRLEEELEQSRLAAKIEPVPKPRRINGHSDVNGEPTSATVSTQARDEELVEGLRNELEKQKRLVTVLRKKLQQQQIDARIQSRTMPV